MNVVIKISATISGLSQSAPNLAPVYIRRAEKMWQFRTKHDSKEAHCNWIKSEWLNF